MTVSVAFSRQPTDRLQVFDPARCWSGTFCEPEVSFIDAGALLVALANYSHKRSVVAKAEAQEPAPVFEPASELMARVEALENKTSKLALASGFGGAK